MKIADFRLKMADCFRKAGGRFRENRQSKIANRKSGAALIVVLWVLTVLAFIISAFAFEMHMESRIISMQRKRIKADHLARAGVEFAKCVLFYEEEDPLASEEDIIYEDPFLSGSAKIKGGVPSTFSQKLGDGTFTVRFDFEKGRRNIKKMAREDWDELLDQSGVPNTIWDELFACLQDWQDENDLHRLNGAESDDPFYRERGYECKNAPLDTVDELLLIKGWTKEILYGTPAEAQTDSPISGMAKQLTTWGDGKINPNSASREVLNSLNIPEDMIERLIEARRGPDGEENTADDGIDDLAELGLSGELFTLKPEYVKVHSTGEVGGLKSKISCIFKLGGNKATPLFWLEGFKL